MSQENIIWVIPPVTDMVRGRLPPGIYHQVADEQWWILTLNDIVVSNVSRFWVQITEQTEWITLPNAPMVWVWWNKNVSPPCLAAIVPAGGYLYEVRKKDREFFLLTRQEYFLNAPPVAVATPTRARGYKKRERKDVASPLTPRGVSAKDVEAYFRRVWGDRVIETEVSGNRAVVSWRPPPPDDGSVIETILEYRDERWHVVDAGFCVSGMDRLLPASILPQLFNAPPGKRVFWVTGV